MSEVAVLAQSLGGASEELASLSHELECIAFLPVAHEAASSDQIARSSIGSPSSGFEIGACCTGIR